VALELDVGKSLFERRKGGVMSGCTLAVEQPCARKQERTRAYRHHQIRTCASLADPSDVLVSRTDLRRYYDQARLRSCSKRVVWNNCKPTRRDDRFFRTCHRERPECDHFIDIISTAEVAHILEHLPWTSEINDDGTVGQQERDRDSPSRLRSDAKLIAGESGQGRRRGPGSSELQEESSIVARMHVSSLWL